MAVDIFGLPPHILSIQTGTSSRRWSNSVTGTHRRWNSMSPENPLAETFVYSEWPNSETGRTYDEREPGDVSSHFGKAPQCISSPVAYKSGDVG